MVTIEIHILSFLEFAKLLALEEDLEHLPEWFCGCERAVDVDRSERETSTNRLVDVDDCIRLAVRNRKKVFAKGKYRPLLTLFQLTDDC